MTKEGITDCISVMYMNWGSYLKQINSEKEMDSYINLWNKMFYEFSDEQVSSAVVKLIRTCKFAPTISEIFENLAEEDIYERDDEEVWEYILDASKNSLYNSYEEWENLPPDIQAIISPSLLKEIALSSPDSLQYYRNDFVKAYHSKISKKRRNYINKAPVFFLEDMPSDINLLENKSGPFTKNHKS